MLTIFLFIFVTSVGLACWWNVAFGRARLRPFFADQSTQARWGLVDVVMIGGLWFGVQVLVTAAFVVALGLQPDNLQALSAAQSGLITVVSQSLQLLVLVGALFYLSLRYGQKIGDFCFSRIGGGPTLLRELTIGMVAFAMWAPLIWSIQSVLTQFIEYKHPTVEALQKNPTAIVVIQSWLSAVILAPIVEEIIFRVVIQGWLHRLRHAPDVKAHQIIYGNRPDELVDKTKMDRPAAFHPLSIVVTSFLFAGAHAQQGPAPYTLFFFSLGLGFVYQRTGSLLACIVMHMLLNFVAMVVFTFKVFLG